MSAPQTPTSATTSYYFLEMISPQHVVLCHRLNGSNTFWRLCIRTFFSSSIRKCSASNGLPSCFSSSSSDYKLHSFDPLYPTLTFEHEYTAPPLRALSTQFSLSKMCVVPSVFGAPRLTTCISFLTIGSPTRQ
jgi:hypothetical protein